MNFSLNIFRRLVPALAAASVFLIIGCSGADKPDDRTSREWYDLGLRQMEKKRYQGAVESFQEAATLYRDAALDADIQLSLAEAYYLDKKYESAIEAYHEFLRLHPRNRKAALAQYMAGMCYFRQMRGSDRSQEATKMSLEAFEKVVRNYPRSELVGDAREKIILCRRRLAEHELYIGRYYLRTSAYAAALQRFDEVYHEYGDLGYGDDALYYLGLCYLKLNDDQKAREVWNRLIRDYPHSRYLEEIEDREG